jgi:hypothetical protein
MGLIATDATGKLNFIPPCYIRVEKETIYMYSLPDITDSKDAGYDEQNGIQFCWIKKNKLEAYICFL